MRDDYWYKPSAPQLPQRRPKPGELLRKFGRGADQRHFWCELQLHTVAQ